MTRAEFKTEIDNTFKYFGFGKGDIDKQIIYKRDITIRTPGETMIVNGRMSQRPGKIGEITLKSIVCDGVGEINDCNEISVPMVSIHLQAYFKDVVFKEMHQMVKIGDIDDMKQFLQAFLHTFGV